MLFLLVFCLLPFLGLCDVFMKDDCWCRNITHIAFQRHYQLNAAAIEGGPAIIDEWCIEASHDGRGKCLDQHTKSYSICASHRAAHKRYRRNDFCYKNHGNHRGMVPHWVKGVPNWISWNDELREISTNWALFEPMTVDENTKYCEPICRDWHGWNLPVMVPISPSKHGVVESRHRLYPHIRDFDMTDGKGGQWPVQEPPISGKKNHNHPGGISTPGEGGIDYWECDAMTDVTC
ncbi:MAG: hypothetical protein Q9181_007911 [Wetmoreana brouardii]